MADIKSGIKNVQIKDLPDTIKCTKKVIEHIRKKQEGERINKGKLQDFEKPSDYEKCVRSTLVKMGLFAFCSLGLGKSICESFDIIKDEEKKLGRRLTDYEIHQIVLDAAKRYGVIVDNINDNYIDDILVHKVEDKGGQIVKQCS